MSAFGRLNILNPNKKTTPPTADHNSATATPPEEQLVVSSSRSHTSESASHNNNAAVLNNAQQQGTIVNSSTEQEHVANEALVYPAGIPDGANHTEVPQAQDLDAVNIHNGIMTGEPHTATAASESPQSTFTQPMNRGSTLNQQDQQQRVLEQRIDILESELQQLVDFINDSRNATQTLSHKQTNAEQADVDYRFQTLEQAVQIIARQVGDIADRITNLEALLIGPGGEVIFNNNQ